MIAQCSKSYPVAVDQSSRAGGQMICKIVGLIFFPGLALELGK